MLFMLWWLHYWRTQTEALLDWAMPEWRFIERVLAERDDP